MFQGPGLVIDDKVFDDSGDSIVRIVSYLESLGYPLAKYDSVLELKGENCRSLGVGECDRRSRNAYTRCTGGSEDG